MVKNLISAKKLMKLIRWWPPYLFTGVSVKSVSNDFLKIRVQMKQKFYNTNYVGSHFGGSLYSMCDPWYMFMLLEHLGPEYIVWDKKATIEFKSPGRGLVYADFELTEEEIIRVKKMADKNPKVEPEYKLKVFNEKREVVAVVYKTLYVRKKLKK